MQLAFLKPDFENLLIGKFKIFVFIVIDDVFTFISAVLFCFLLSRILFFKFFFPSFCRYFSSVGLEVLCSIFSFYIFK